MEMPNSEPNEIAVLENSTRPHVFSKVLVLLFAIAVIGIALILWDTLVLQHNTFSVGDSGRNLFWIAAACVLGISSKVVSDAIQESPGKRRSKSIRKRIFNGLALHNLIRALLLAPVALLALLQAIQHVADFKIVLLLAYQNGFFFQSVLPSKTNGS
jgi:hypothetical protein